MLAGRPLVSWVGAALGAVLDEVVVVARPDSALDGSLTVWREPADRPRHPLFGIAWALQRAGGRAVLVCAVDLPFVSIEALMRLRDFSADVAVVVAAGQPLLGRYGPSATGSLLGGAQAGASTRAVVAALGAVEVRVADPERTLFNVNSDADLTVAEGLVGRGSCAGGPPRPR